MINIAWQDFPRFPVALFIEVGVFRKKKGGGGVGSVGNSKNRLLHVYVATQEFLLRQKATACLGHDSVMKGIPMSLHCSQILSNRNYRNMAFFVATGVLVLCHDNVTIEVSLS